VDIILPGLKIRQADIRGPFFFLAGPHCGEWHEQMCLAFKQRLHICTIACPARWTDDHPLMLHFRFAGLQPVVSYREWEETHLELAGITAPHGAIIFWFPPDQEDKSVRLFPAEVFRGFAAWRCRIKRDSARVIVGAAPAYSGFRQLKLNLKEALGYDFPVHETIEATMDAAIKLALA
jgi:hypothetical protein